MREAFMLNKISSQKVDSASASSGGAAAVRHILRGNVLWIIAALILLAAVAAPLLSPQNPFDLAQLDVMDSMLAPLSKAGAGYTYWLGTDDQGRDMVSAILYGMRTSLVVAFGSAALSMSIGVLLGLFCAYYRGRLDSFVMRMVDLFLAFPAILVALIILGFLGKGVLNVVIALVVVDWAFYARGVRGIALSESKRDYVQAAQCNLIPDHRIIFGHVLPNCMSSLMVLITQQIARAIAIEATLSFLGLGVPITQPSLGLLIANGYPQVISGRYWISFFPGMTLFLMIVVINLLGDHVRKRYGKR
jgi:peptide/nickel transport system permease protein